MIEHKHATAAVALAAFIVVFTLISGRLTENRLEREFMEARAKDAAVLAGWQTSYAAAVSDANACVEYLSDTLWTINSHPQIVKYVGDNPVYRRSLSKWATTRLGKKLTGQR